MLFDIHNKLAATRTINEICGIPCISADMPIDKSFIPTLGALYADKWDVEQIDFLCIHITSQPVGEDSFSALGILPLCEALRAETSLGQFLGQRHITEDYLRKSSRTRIKVDSDNRISAFLCFSGRGRDALQMFDRRPEILEDIEGENIRLGCVDEWQAICTQPYAVVFRVAFADIATIDKTYASCEDNDMDVVKRKLFYRACCRAAGVDEAEAVVTLKPGVSVPPDNILRCIPLDKSECAWEFEL